MSLARSFMLAGASSIVKTGWEVNDETSAEIISGFYHYLSKGKHKDEAMRLSKLDYLKEAPPAFTGPYYWAGYEMIGDNSTVVTPTGTCVGLLILTGVFISALIFYFSRKRRIFSERSL